MWRHLLIRSSRGPRILSMPLSQHRMKTDALPTPSSTLQRSFFNFASATASSSSASHAPAARRASSSAAYDSHSFQNTQPYQQYAAAAPTSGYSQSSSSTYAEYPTAPSPSASSLHRASYIVKLERLFFSHHPIAPTAAELLRQMNEQGFPQRVIDTYECKLSSEDAADREVIQETWIAMDAIKLQQAASKSAPRTGSSTPGKKATRFPVPKLPSYAFTKSSASSYAASPSASTPPPGNSDKQEIFVSVYGHDPSRFREYLNLEVRRAEDHRQKRLAFIANLMGYLGLIAILVYHLGKASGWDTDKMARMIEDQTSNALGGSGKKKVMPHETPKTRFTDVKGCDEAKLELVEVVEYLKNPSKFDRLGGKMSRGVLLLGPPGTGKTLLARAVAGEAGFPFFAATGADFEEKYVGVGAKRVRELFQEARKHRPSIIFIDEIDTIGGKRDDFDNPKTRMSLNQLLSELDGFQSSGVIVVAATNYMEKLDPALVRAGRFDKHVTVAPPDIKGRREILEMYGKKIKLDKNVDLAALARGTSGMTGADLYHLLNSASLYAATQNRPAVGDAELEYAKDKILMGAERKSGVNQQELKQHIAVYESGRSLVALKTPNARPLHKVTIIQRGSRLGVTTQTQGTDEDVTQQSYAEMLAALDCRLAGRVAEELIYGEGGFSSHAGSDLAAANQLARAMIMKWGFGEQRGVVADSDLAQFSEDASDHSKAQVDDAIRHLLAESYQRTKTLLSRNKHALNELTTELLSKEILDAREVKRIVGDR